ncbi:MAG: hypothetical protein IKO19_02515 [Candidatus Riflebacteria bacterium]|nr:hypothetical protein [Candidatus Riflebacteria bacterium]
MNNIYKYLFKALFLILVLFLNNSFIYAQNIASDSFENPQLFWKPKLEYAFTKTFSSSHEFSACQVFQCLDYNLAEITQIRRITPFPASLTVEFDGIEEAYLPVKTDDNSVSTQTRVLKFKKLDVICDKVHYFDMEIERMTFGFPDSVIEYDYLDKGRLKFVSASKIDLLVKVSENDLLSVLNLYPRAKALSNVKIILTPNQCQSKGRVKLGFLVAEYKIKGFIKQVSPKIIDFSCSKLTINGITQPRAFVKTIMSYINPVFDSSKVWINLNISSMNIIKGYVMTNAVINKKEIKNAN